MKTTMIGLLCMVFLTACSKRENKADGHAAEGDISATMQFSDGKKVDFAFTPKQDDIIKPSVNGPNGNGHYKLWLRGEKTIDNHIYTINLYVTMPEEGVGTYPFGIAWQWHDEGFVTELHIGVTEVGNPLALKQYVSTPPAVDNADSKGVTITSLTGNHVVGTFAGKAGYTESDIVTITNGKFDIDIKQGTWED